jgi:hypothetical protein
MSFLNLEVLKGEPTKSIWILTCVKLSKNMFLGQRNWKKTKTKIATHMDLWKYGQMLTIQKSLYIKWSRFSKKKSFVWIYHFVLHCILSPNNKFGMWINILFSILWCSSHMTTKGPSSKVSCSILVLLFALFSCCKH